MIATTSINRRIRSLALLLALFITIIGFTPASAQAAKGPDDPDEMEAFFDGAIGTSMSTNHVPGAVVVVVKDGAVFFAKGYGYADVETFKPVDPETTLFRPGSVSKLFTWTAVMQLVEQGKLDLDEDVNTYIDFVIPDTFEQPTTLRHLLTHTPGFEDRGENLFKLTPEEISSLSDFLKENLPARVFPPGQVGSYSNYGTALAGYIVERVSGQEFTDYIQQHIFDPLGMEHATFVQPLPDHLAGDMASGYNYYNGGFVKGGFEYVNGMPAGSLSASGLDMARFMIAHLQNGQFEDSRILSEATARRMHSPLYTPDPRLPSMAYGFFQNYVNGQYVISHGGDTILFHTSLQLLPQENLGIFISTNGAAGANLVESVFDAFYDHYYPQEPISLEPDSDFDSRSEIYAGSYMLSRSNFTTLEKLFSRMNPVAVTIDEHKNVLLSSGGNINQFVETEPGLLVSRSNPDMKLVLVQREGQIILETGAPFVFIKTAWYDSLNLHVLIFIGSAFLFLVTMITWAVSLAGSLKKREKLSPLASWLARLAAVLFGLLLLVFLFGIAATFLDINPAYGVPNIYFGFPASLLFLLQLPVVLGILAVGMVIFSIMSWAMNYWSAGGRVFYSFLTLLALAVVWGLIYWNMLL